MWHVWYRVKEPIELLSLARIVRPFGTCLISPAAKCLRVQVMFSQELPRAAVESFESQLTAHRMYRDRFEVLEPPMFVEPSESMRTGTVCADCQEDIIGLPFQESFTGDHLMALCGVAQRTVKKWFHSKRLKGSWSCVLRRDLVSFMLASGVRPAGAPLVPMECPEDDLSDTVELTVKPSQSKAS